jgi:hypothetical protein
VNHLRAGTLLGVVILAAMGMPLFSTGAQNPAEQQKQQEMGSRRIEKLLDEWLVNPKNFQKDMPLAQFLDALQQKLPKDKQVAVRIDKEAFGADFAEVASTPMPLVSSTSKWSLRGILESVIGKIKAKADFRLGTNEIVITTPQRANYTVSYDIRDLIEKPGFLVSNLLPTVVVTEVKFLRDLEPAEKAALIVQVLGADVDRAGDKLTAPVPESIQVLNGTQLIIHATGARHSNVHEWLTVFRRLNDVAVSIKAEVHEVDEDFYKKLGSAKYVPLEEAELEFLKQPGVGQTPKAEAPLKLLETHKALLAAEVARIDDGLEAADLAWHQVGRYRPSPTQVGKGETSPQTIWKEFHSWRGCGSALSAAMFA